MVRVRRLPAPAHAGAKGALSLTLTGKQRRYLRGLGHKLKSVVQIGKQGVTDAVLVQVEANLLAHELIKIKVLEGGAERDACADAVCRATGAVVAQGLGRTLLLYRPHPEQPRLQLPHAS